MAAFFGGFGGYGGGSYPGYGFSPNSMPGMMGSPNGMMPPQMQRPFGAPFMQQGGQPFAPYGYAANQFGGMMQQPQQNPSAAPFGTPIAAPGTAQLTPQAPTAQQLQQLQQNLATSPAGAVTTTIPGTTLFTHTGLPNPKIIDIVAAVKGIKFDNVRELNVVAGDNRTEEILDKMPTGQVPFVELPSGMVLGETVAIALWLEDTFPSPPLFGETADEKAITTMHALRCDHYINGDLIQAWRCRDGETGGYSIFEKRRPLDQGAAAMYMKRGMNGLDMLDKDLATSQRTFVAWGRPSFADIPLFCTLDFFFGFGEKHLSPTAEEVLTGRPALAAWWLRVLDLFGEHAHQRTQETAEIARKVVEDAEKGEKKD